MFFIRECRSRVYIALSILYINIYSGREYNNRCLVKVLRYYIYVYNIVIYIRRVFQRGTSITIIVQTNWSDFLFHLFILLRWCTSTFFAVFNEARILVIIFSEKTSRRYVKGIFLTHLSPAYKVAIILSWRPSRVAQIFYLVTVRIIETVFNITYTLCPMVPTILISLISL